LFAGRMIGVRGELGVEVAFGSVEGGREPAFEAGPERDDAHLGGEAGRQAQAGGAQARKEARVLERGDGQTGGRSRRRAAPHAAVEEVKRLGA